MAITFRDSTIKNGGSASSVTIDKPTGTVEGDLLIASILGGNLASNPTPPDESWTEFGPTGTPQSFSFITRCYYKVAGSSEPSDYTFTFPGTNTSHQTNMASFYETEGVDTWSLIDESWVQSDGTTNSLTTGSITGIDDGLLITCFSTDDNEEVSTAPTDMTLIDEIKYYNGSANYYELRDAGAVTKSITWGGSAEQEQATAGFFIWGEAPATGTNMKINIGDTFKDVDSMKINIADTWKDVTGMQINIGDDWKTIF